MIDALLVALMRRLPPAGTPMTVKRKREFVAALSSAIDVIYPEPDDPTPPSVGTQEGNANG